MNSHQRRTLTRKRYRKLKVIIERDAKITASELTPTIGAIELRGVSK